MEKKIFNFKYYEPALKELWEKKVPDVKIASVMGLSNSVISRYRRAFKLPFVLSNTKVNMSEEAIKQVFIKHGCCNFSEDIKYGGFSTTLLSQRESFNELSSRKLIPQDFFKADSAHIALENFVFYNLYAPKSRVIQFLDELFIRHHKQPLSKNDIKDFYSKALRRYEEQFGYTYRFATPVYNDDNVLSELFVIYLIVYFATKAKNKNCNPKFISKYCEFMYEVGPIKQSYLAELYAVLGIAISDEDYVPSDEDFKKERVRINNKESNLFVPFPILLSSTETFALPFWASKKYETWCKCQTSKVVSIPGIIETIPPVIEDNVEMSEVVEENDIINEEDSCEVNSKESEVAYTLDNLPHHNSTLLVSELSVEEKRDIYFKALVDAAVGFVSTEDYYLAASLLQIIHAEKHDKKYTVDLKEGD